MPGIPYNFIVENFESKCNLDNQTIKIDNVNNQFIVGDNTKLTRVCPHNGCLLNVQKNNQGFICPCHKSTFDKCGNCLSGPACPNSIKIN